MTFFAAARPQVVLGEEQQGVEVHLLAGEVVGVARELRGAGGVAAGGKTGGLSDSGGEIRAGTAPRGEASRRGGRRRATRLKVGEEGEDSRAGGGGCGAEGLVGAPRFLAGVVGGGRRLIPARGGTRREASESDASASARVQILVRR